MESVIIPQSSVIFPASGIWLPRRNPCPCGYFGDSVKKCICTLNNIKKYQGKISGPILDRIDLQVEVKRLTEAELTNKKTNENHSSEAIKEKVLKAKENQRRRYKDISPSHTNSHLSSKEIKHFCELQTNAQNLLKEAIKTFSLTARSYDRVLKVSRTIADLAKSDIIKDEHVLEALQFRFNTIFKA